MLNDPHRYHHCATDLAVTASGKCGRERGSRFCPGLRWQECHCSVVSHCQKRPSARQIVRGYSPRHPKLCVKPTGCKQHLAAHLWIAHCHKAAESYAAVRPVSEQLQRQGRMQSSIPKMPLPQWVLLYGLQWQLRVPRILPRVFA